MYKQHSTWFCLVTAFFIACSSSVFANQTYQVARGDNLYRIGLKFGVSYKDIMRANGMRKTTIYPNQTLIIPTTSATTTVTPTPAVQSPAPRTAPTPPPVAQPPLIAQNRPLSPAPDVGALPTLEKVKPYREATTPQDPAPQEPYAAARKVATPAPTPAKKINEEDPLGLGYDPNQNAIAPPVSRAPSPPVIVQAPKSPKPTVNKAPPSTYSKPKTYYPPKSSAKQPAIVKAIPKANPKPKTRTYRRGREVPAAAQYPGKSSTPYNPPSYTYKQEYPMPSFKNPCTPKPRSRHYTVKSGDNVWGISRRFNINPIKLRKANKILFSRIHPGMKLVIPSD